jgi:hypothetical protein
MASLSLREVLTGNIAERAKSLFGTSIKDVQAACRAFSSPKNFALLAKQFYATFTNRSLSFITDKELSNYVGPGKSLSYNDFLTLSGIPPEVFAIGKSVKGKKSP